MLEWVVYRQHHRNRDKGRVYLGKQWPDDLLAINIAYLRGRCWAQCTFPFTIRTKGMMTTYANRKSNSPLTFTSLQVSFVQKLWFEVCSVLLSPLGYVYWHDLPQQENWAAGHIRQPHIESELLPPLRWADRHSQETGQYESLKSCNLCLAHLLLDRLRYPGLAMCSMPSQKSSPSGHSTSHHSTTQHKQSTVQCRSCRIVLTSN